MSTEKKPQTLRERMISVTVRGTNLDKNKQKEKK